MVKNNNMKKKHRHGMKVITSIHRTSKIKNELIRKCNRRETNMNREKYKKMINTELLERFQKPWRKKYHKIVNKRVWERERRYMWDLSPILHRKVLTLKAKKKSLKPVKMSFSNDDFIPYTNPYVQHKFSEKDKEIERLQQLLKDIEYDVRCQIGGTYQAQAKSGKFAYKYRMVLHRLNSNKETRYWKR